MFRLRIGGDGGGVQLVADPQRCSVELQRALSWPSEQSDSTVRHDSRRHGAPYDPVGDELRLGPSPDPSELTESSLTRSS
jgi:hypothetical protein